MSLMITAGLGDSLMSRGPTRITTASTGAIDLAVSPSGNDTVAGRPGVITSGDWTTYPFLTLQAAVNALPSLIRHRAVITVAAGTYAGFHCVGRTGGVYDSVLGEIGLIVVGATSLATLASGTNSGTAGAGTTTTQLNKPAAAANWTASDLRGRFLRITGGGGVSADSDIPTIRPIKSNTATALVVDTVPGMDATTVFQIVDMTSIIHLDPSPMDSSTDSCVGLALNTLPIMLALLELGDAAVGDLGLHSTGNDYVSTLGLHLSAPAGGSAVTSTNDERARIQDCIVDEVVNVGPSSDVSVNRCTVDTGGVTLTSCQDVDVVLDAKSGATYAVHIARCINASVVADADDTTSTPYVFSATLRLTSTLSGTTAAAGTYGVEVLDGGHYDVTGASATGALGNLLLENQVVTWASFAGDSRTQTRDGTVVMVTA